MLCSSYDKSVHSKCVTAHHAPKYTSYCCDNQKRLSPEAIVVITGKHIIFMALHILRQSCFCEVWRFCVMWVSYDHSYMHIYIYIYIYLFKCTIILVSIYLYFIIIYLIIKEAIYIYIYIYIYICKYIYIYIYKYKRI